MTCYKEEREQRKKMLQREEKNLFESGGKPIYLENLGKPLPKGLTRGPIVSFQ